MGGDLEDGLTTGEGKWPRTGKRHSDLRYKEVEEKNVDDDDDQARLFFYWRRLRIREGPS